MWRFHEMRIYEDDAVITTNEILGEVSISITAKSNPKDIIKLEYDEAKSNVILIYTNNEIPELAAREVIQ